MRICYGSLIAQPLPPPKLSIAGGGVSVGEHWEQSPLKIITFTVPSFPDHTPSHTFVGWVWPGNEGTFTGETPSLCIPVALFRHFFCSIQNTLRTPPPSIDLSPLECHALQQEELETLKAIYDHDLTPLNDNCTCFVVRIRFLSEEIKEEDVIKIWFRSVVAREILLHGYNLYHPPPFHSKKDSCFSCLLRNEANEHMVSYGWGVLSLSRL